MRRLLTLLWLLFPVGVLAFHFGPGQHWVRRERAAAHLRRIQRMESAPAEERDWARIVAEYDALERSVAATEPPRVVHQVRLARARARLEQLEIAEAITDLTALLQEAAVAHGEDDPLTRAVRENLGRAHYQATCLLQAHNAAESEWRPYAERARQLFRFLAERQDPRALADYERRVERELQRAAARARTAGEG